MIYDNFDIINSLYQNKLLTFGEYESFQFKFSDFFNYPRILPKFVNLLTNMVHHDGNEADVIIGWNSTFAKIIYYNMINFPLQKEYPIFCENINSRIENKKILIIANVILFEGISYGLNEFTNNDIEIITLYSNHNVINIHSIASNLSTSAKVHSILSEDDIRTWRKEYLKDKKYNDALQVYHQEQLAAQKLLKAAKKAGE